VSSKPSASEKTGAVLVVGGGIAGIQASLDLAESGYKVYLVEKSPAIGGTMPQLDKTFPTNDCSMCILSPKLVECGRHLNIEVITYADVLDVKGEPGNFTVSVKKRARYVDEALCTGCGVCQEKCPAKTASEFNRGLGQRKAIYVPYAQAVPNVPVIDKDICIYFKKGKCRVCEKLCQSKAIDFNQTDQVMDVNVGSVILCPGLDEFDPHMFTQYGYGRFPNVLTSIEFERILSASGPFQGHLMRPSDKEVPKSIAWVQCVGSRDIHHAQKAYCSSVCCTYAIKEAVVAKEHSTSPLETTIFMMDIRTFGKGFERYYERAKEEHGVRFIRARINTIFQDSDGDLIIRYMDEERVKEEKFGMVVLSVGLEPSAGSKELADKFGVKLNSYGFCQAEDFSPVTTSRPGIFSAGVFTGPKDIPETVMEASAAASDASRLLSGSRHSLTNEKQYPPEIDVRGERPRIGVFVCHCGINIAGVVDVAAVKEYARTLPNVVFADQTLFACSQDIQQRIKDTIKEHRLNRVIVASCSPRTHEPLFQETLREAGLNKYLFEMANIRDQCSWVHMQDGDKATEKSMDLVRMAVAKANLIEPLSQVPLEVTNTALVVGGGISGMVSALNLGDQGFQVHLVEKTSQLGGIANRHHHTLEGLDIQAYLKTLVQQVSKEPLIHVHKETEILEASGYVGNFKTKLKSHPGTEIKEIKHGVVVIATGGDVLKPQEYLYGKDPRVFTILELNDEIAKGNPKIMDSQTLVMIQCVGSREKERLYCSRVCCNGSIKTALKLKKINPEMNIYILYRDIRTYGFKELYYQEARDKGIVFIRYDVTGKPVVQTVHEDGKEILRVTLTDPILGEPVSIDADTLSLATAIIAPSGNDEIAQFFKVPLNEDRFFLEAHVKLRPVDFATEGVFVCGLAHSPKLIEESITQAKAAASRAAAILSKATIEAGGVVSLVDQRKCTGCSLCQQLCPFNAIDMDEKKNVAVINEALCKGCGVCASSCRSGAVTLKGFTDQQVVSMIDALCAS
jgi:heterodisulfide reductase subunit A